MRRPAALVAAVMLVAGLSACNGDSDEAASEPEPETTETTPAGPPPQPEGADGVTWEIQNWEDHADDPAVLTWKQFNEAVAASINQRELLPAARELAARPALAPFVASFEYARENEFTVQDLTYAKVVSSEVTDDSATLVGCSWGPSSVLYRPDGDPVDELEERWIREVVTLANGDGWTIESVDFDGSCDGGDPT